MSTLKKSLTTMTDAWALRKVSQLKPERPGAGLIPSRRRRLRIAVAETTWPTLTNSRLIRTQP